MDDSSGRDDGKLREHAAGPTIVGGRPLRGGRQPGSIPRGIEVLVKKASVDPEFRKALLERRARASDDIGLELSAAETTMLDSVPQAQIEQIIENTTVPDEQRRVFLGRLAAAMLAVLGIGLSPGGCSVSFGITPDRPREHYIGGIRPDSPPVPHRPQYNKYTTAVPVEPHEGRFKVSVSPTGRYSLTVTVGYDCPFDRGKVTISLRIQQYLPTDRVTYVPTEISVSKGKGEATFSVIAKDLETDQILVALLNNTEPCQQKASKEFERMPDLERGEYRVGDCVLCKVVHYYRAWPA